MAVSTLLALALIAYLLYQAVTLPSNGAPKAEVAGVETMPEGDVLVTVTLINEGPLGMREVGVEIRCGDPPVEITFENVPAQSTRTGKALCPPGTTQPEVGVSFWRSA